MTKEEKLQILDAAIDLTYRRLAALKAEDMDSEAMGQLLNTLSGLSYTYERIKYPCTGGVVGHAIRDEYEQTEADIESTDTETAAPIPKLEPDPAELPKHPATPEPAQTEATTMTLVEVRTILADLSGRANIDLPALLAQFGAEKLSLVDPASYAALVQAAKIAAGEA